MTGRHGGCIHDATLSYLAGQHGALLEVLEVPQLLDACARGGAVDEALDLRAFVSRAALLHPDLQARRAPERSNKWQPCDGDPLAAEAAPHCCVFACQQRRVLYGSCAGGCTSAALGAPPPHLHPARAARAR